MSQITRIASVSALMLVGLACSILSGPISGAQSVASTAEAVATSVASGMPDMPDLPDVTGFLNPSGAPVSEWKGIPILPQAIAGQEFNQSTYSFRVPGVTGIDIEEFYDAQLEALGWSTPVRTNIGTAGGYMLYTKGTTALSIMVTKSEGEIVVLLIVS